MKAITYKKQNIVSITAKMTTLVWIIKIIIIIIVINIEFAAILAYSYFAVLDLCP